MLNWLITTSLKNRLLVAILAAALILVGGRSLTNLPIDAFPDTTPVQVQINTVAPALSPLEIERQATALVEQAIGGLPGLDEVRADGSAAPLVHAAHRLLRPHVPRRPGGGGAALGARAPDEQRRRQDVALGAPLEIAAGVERVAAQGVEVRLVVPRYGDESDEAGIVRVAGRPVPGDREDRLVGWQAMDVPQVHLYEFDDVFTAPLHGFRDTPDYWARASAKP